MKNGDQIIDKHFGWLTFLENPDSGTFWCGSAMFNKQRIDIFITSANNYPTILQKNWFDETELNYSQWIPKIFGILPERLKTETRFADFDYFKKHFKPRVLNIPDLNTAHIAWNMTFQSLNNYKHFLSVWFADGVPLKATLET